MVVMTRSRRAAEVRLRCSRAVGLLGVIVLTGAQYVYTEGMVSDEDRDLVVYLVRVVVLSSTRVGPPAGPWVDQEMLVLRALFTAGWMVVHSEHLPPALRRYINLFREDRQEYGSVRLLCDMRYNVWSRNVFLRVGFFVVLGVHTFHMPAGSSRILRTGGTPDESPESSVVFSTSSGDCPQFDKDGHYIETSMENRLESETEEEGDEPDNAGS